MRRALVGLCLLTLMSCSRNTSEDQSAKECADVVVLAGSSLGQAVKSVDWNECPRTVSVSLASSSVLAAQIVEGAPADIFVSAGEGAINQLRSEGLLAGDPVTIGVNRGVLMVSTRSVAALSVMSLRDLASKDLTVGACVSSAPCGGVFDDIMENAAIAFPQNATSFQRSILVDTESPNAADLVTKVSLGEIDAGIVYASDCAPGSKVKDVRCVEIPTTLPTGELLNSRVAYIAGRLSDRRASRAVFAYLTSREFQDILIQKFDLDAP